MTRNRATVHRMFTLLLLLLPHVSSINQPHIVLMMADDLGWSDVPWHDDTVIAPTLAHLADTGIILERHYIHQICTPTRAALMTGKYASNLGMQTKTILVGAPYGLSLQETLLSEYLQSAGYATHAIGKWHLGCCSWDYTPVKRGFHSFYGFYNGGQKYFDKTNLRNGAFDFRYNTLDENGDVKDEILWEANTTYSTTLYAKQAEQIISQHNSSQPLFLYYPSQSVHKPFFVPDTYRAAYREKGRTQIRNQRRLTLLAMVSAMDESVGAVVNALKKADMWNNTIFIFFSDNGGYVRAGQSRSSNYPLRGGKYSYYDGGIRSPSFVSSPLLSDQAGRVSSELMHVTDWLPTLTYLAKCGTDADPDCKGPEISDIDGVNQWPVIAGNTKSNRTEIVIDAYPISLQGGLIMYPWKLITGEPGQLDNRAGLRSPPDSNIRNNDVVRDEISKIKFNKTDVQLYNLETDPSELDDVSKKEEETVKVMQTRLAFHRTRASTPRTKRIDPNSDADQFGGVWTPWLDKC